MQVFSAKTVHRSLAFASLIEALREAFREPVKVPSRQQLSIDSEKNPGTMLLMPCWQTDTYLALKVVSIFTQNPKRGLPTVIGTVLLFDGQTGRPLAAMDGSAVTVRRTAATSALAADYLARPDATTLLVLGAGALAPHLARAHATTRSLRKISIWNRSHLKAQQLVSGLRDEGLPAQATRDLQSAAAEADVISCATSSREPLIRGSWLKPGTHLDLVGSYTPDMCEADADAVAASRVFVDTREGALSEAGDLIQPMRTGAWSANRIQGDLHEMVSQDLRRRSDNEQTLFKSVGVALEDLVAARLVYERQG